MNIWQQVDAESASVVGRYIAVSGNTGSGKSTLVRAIASELERTTPGVIAVDERNFHHPLLPLMFSNATKYALPIQLNFCVQRGTFLLRSTERHRTIVMERSHYDDRLFVEDHRSKGHINDVEFEAYAAIGRWFDAALPSPDIFVLLDIDAESSFSRVKSSEAAGERPVEFPDDRTLRSYITSWRERYCTFFDGLLHQKKQGKFPNTTFLRISEPLSRDQIMSVVLPILRGKVSDAHRL
jgi:deoxyadenosine/deoxycytidine kinase